MFLHELSAGQQITLTAMFGSETMEFETKMLEAYPKKNIILAEPIFKNEKVVSFHAKNLMVHISVLPPDSAPLIFKNVTIGLMRKPDNSLCYSLSCKTEGKINNRRQTYRCYIGTATSVMCGTNKAAKEAILKDVSAGGFAVVCGPEADYREGQVLHVLLNDTIEELAESFSFHLYGIIVRKAEMENERILYGCRLNNKVMGLDTYIVKKERIRLKNNAR